MYKVVREKHLKEIDRAQFLEQCCIGVKHIVDKLTQYSNSKAYETKTFANLAKAFEQSYFAIRKPLSFAREYRITVCKNVLSEASTVYAFGAIFHDLMSKGINCEFNLQESQQMDLFLYPLINLQAALFYYLDSTPIFGKKLVFCEVYMETVRNALRKFFPPVKEDRASKELKSLVEYIIAGIYNALRHEDAEISARVIELRLTDIVRAYASCEDPKIQMAAYMFLAYTETEMSVLEMRESRTIEIFIECLGSATHSDYKQSRGYSVLELAKAIRILAQNDANKRALVDKGILPCLKNMLQSNKVDEEEEALLTLWTLSFDPESKKRIEEELGTLLPAVEQKLSEFKTSGQENASTSAQKSDQPTAEAACVTIEAEQEEDPEVAFNNRKRKKQAAERALRGLIWQLGISVSSGGKEIYRPALLVFVFPRYKQNGKNPQAAPANSGTLTDKHVMISYNHQHRQIASEIAHRLRQNHFKVWIDLDNMKSVDDLMDGMGHRRGETLYIVLVLFSRKPTKDQSQYSKFQLSCL
ncbi:hypothetical protein FGIG_09781 [Fasciola gigantica]|uniref:TIR domain-containing protein n=1 Tax=Fasciola gigantica TaxID=46835 RepID=A0A504YDG8_FASGI|nr:hypothetical protein FGIG_09781 [Fasciola gigantica]